MANFVIITLDTQGPANPSLTIEGGSTFTANQLVNLDIGTTDADTTSYEMLIWGDVDPAYDAKVQSTEVTAQWMPYALVKQVKLSSGDGDKTIYLKIRDDVHNESSQTSDTIKLDATMPVVTTTNPDIDRVSEKPGKNIFSFSFTASEPFQEYKIKVVGNEGATHDTGTQIPTTNGSVNTSGVGAFDTSTNPISVSIQTADLKLASSADGDKIVKVFVMDQSGKWSA